MATADRRDHTCLVGTGKGTLGGIRDHFAFSRFLDTVEHPGVTGARQRDSRVLPRRVRFTDVGLASESVVMTGPPGDSGTSSKQLWDSPIPGRVSCLWGMLAVRVLGYQATE